MFNTTELNDPQIQSYLGIKSPCLNNKKGGKTASFTVKQSAITVAAQEPTAAVGVLPVHTGMDAESDCTSDSSSTFAVSAA